MDQDDECWAQAADAAVASEAAAAVVTKLVAAAAALGAGSIHLASSVAVIELLEDLSPVTLVDSAVHEPGEKAANLSVKMLSFDQAITAAVVYSHIQYLQVQLAHQLLVVAVT